MKMYNRVEAEEMIKDDIVTTRIELDSNKLAQMRREFQNENLLIIGNSQRGKTSILKNFLKGRSANSFLLVDSFDELNVDSEYSVKKKNGLYPKDFENEVTKFAIRTSTDISDVQTIFYDDFYGDEMKEVVDFLESKKGRNIIATINHPNLLEGYKMIVKGVYNNKKLPLNSRDIEILETHFNKVVHLGNTVQIFDVLFVDDEIIFKNI